MMRPFSVHVSALLACVTLAACSNPPSSQTRAVFLRDGKPDAGALAATGIAAGARPMEDVSCRQQVQGAGKLPGCEFRLAPGEIVFGPYERLAPGSYDVSFGLETPAGCPGGKIQLDVITPANDYKPLALRRLTVAGPQFVHLAFSINSELADWAPMVFRTSFLPRSNGCVVLSSVKVSAR
jgi:hypothetical protein